MRPVREKAAEKCGFYFGVSFCWIWMRGREGRYLVGRGIGGEADVAVDSEAYVFIGEVGDGGVDGDDLVGEGGDVGFPVLEGAAVLGVVY